MENQPQELYTPPYPKPLSKKDGLSKWQLFKRGRISNLNVLFEGDYRKDLSKIDIAGFKIYTPTSPSVIKDTLHKNYKEFPKHKFMNDILKPLLGNSIFTTNGETWERQRRIIDIGFEKAGLRNVFQLMTDAVKAMHERLEAHPQNTPLQMDFEMTHVTADIIMRTILSSPITSKNALEIFHFFAEFQEKSSELNMLKMFRLPKWFSTKNYILWKRRGRQIRKFIGDTIATRHAEYIEKGGKTNYGDILEALMATEDPVTKTKFDRQELIDQVAMLFLAGHETSASSLAWTFYILANQPHHAEALATEAETIFPDLDLPSFKHVHKLKKTRDVFREALRLYPPVSLISRQATGKCPLGDREVEPDATINISAWLVHRREQVWSDPHCFKPERFAEGENKKNPGAFLSFSFGPRICVGAGFAMQEAMLIISTITKKYHLTPTPNFTPEPVARLTLRSLNGIKVNIQKRTEPKKVDSNKNQNSSVVQLDEEIEKCPYSP